jgi:hypothetical protein
MHEAVGLLVLPGLDGIPEITSGSPSLIAKLIGQSAPDNPLLFNPRRVLCILNYVTHWTYEELAGSWEVVSLSPPTPGGGPQRVLLRLATSDTINGKLRLVARIEDEDRDRAWIIRLGLGWVVNHEAQP